VWHGGHQYHSDLTLIGFNERGLMKCTLLAPRKLARWL